MQNLNVNGKAPAQEDGLPSSVRTPIQLIGDIARMMGDRIRSTGEEHPVSQKSGRLLLMELARRDGRTQLDLVHATHLKAPTISVALQKLEKDGYVSRRPDEYDLRATRVFLTEKGRALDDKIRRHIHAEESEAMKNLTDSEREGLMRLLNKIKTNLTDTSEKDGDLY
ncbi:MAG: MarR family transcriptional regulator [Clostridia bacterium]|nr:MarR family transcriptional regulator [Clostridia bacterium]